VRTCIQHLIVSTRQLLQHLMASCFQKFLPCHLRERKVRPDSLCHWVPTWLARIVIPAFNRFVNWDCLSWKWAIASGNTRGNRDGVDLPIQLFWLDGTTTVTFQPLYLSWAPQAGNSCWTNRVWPMPYKGQIYKGWIELKVDHRHSIYLSSETRWGQNIENINS